ncbi:TetR/AcrR family transcriptional regulator [Acidaminobacter sp. JC074]|uniref:TetR/AcrR family transcriptional regulator n=1 Tax=Acidaminobacter sp. JC074 TaxID=2530199 RepID=UPI001F0E4DA4|nr:TetR/AcrR family transcriptional regulator [Acidaminobacter sp. JC074]MCH4888117.1 TetR/AcrR family transcriptional regulator [Acidaminobacter sp. JC074]
MTYSNPVFDKISEEKKNRIINIAIDEFSTNGFSRANINTIAAKAGVSVGSLYKYFNNKHDMYLYVVSTTVEKIKGILEDIVIDNSDLFETIRKIIRAIQTYSKVDANATRLYNVMATERNEELVVQLCTQMEGATADVYAGLIEKFQAQGKISKDLQPRYFAFFLDNLFMMLQFSYTCEYYKHRLKLYVSEDALENDQVLEDELMRFITGAFQLKN